MGDPRPTTVEQDEVQQDALGLESVSMFDLVTRYVESCPRHVLHQPNHECLTEGEPQDGRIDNSSAEKPSRLPEALGLPGRSRLTIDEQVPGEPMWLP